MMGMVLRDAENTDGTGMAKLAETCLQMEKQYCEVLQGEDVDFMLVPCTACAPYILEEHWAKGEQDKFEDYLKNIGVT
jgi:hypothetical protein